MDFGVQAAISRMGKRLYRVTIDLLANRAIGKVFVGIAADAGLVPDHEQIVDGFADAFRRLKLLTAVQG